MTTEAHRPARMNPNARQPEHEQPITQRDHLAAAIKKRWSRATPADRAAVGKMLAEARARKRQERHDIKDATAPQS